VEQDHRAIKRRVNASLGFRSFDGAQRTIQGYEAMNMIHKEQIRWLAKSDFTEQIRFIKGRSVSPPDPTRRQAAIRSTLVRLFATHPFIQVQKR